MFQCRAPKTDKEFDQYYQLRWQILRAPWQQPEGSEQDEFENQAFHRAIFNDQGNVIAVARLHCVSQNEAQIRFMAVSESYRGKNLGRQLLDALEKLASEVGVQRVSLNARDSAQDFYNKAGYELLGLSHLLYGQVQHVKMQKVLSPPADHKRIMSNDLQDTWHSTIPLSKAMDINIAYYKTTKLHTNCDLAFNKNLHQTMFAGSVYTLATLTGWGWVYLFLAENKLEGDIVLADAKIRYHSPLSGVGYARVVYHSEESAEDNVQLFNKNKKLKMSVEVEVCCGDTLAATFNGLYFAVSK